MPPSRCSTLFGCRSLTVLVVLAVGRLWFDGFGRADPPLLDDRRQPVETRRQVGVLRAKLIRHVWGQSDLPRDRVPDSIEKGVESPIQQLKSLARVDAYRMDLAPGLKGLAYHFIPTQPNLELVVVHHGHACSMDDDAGAGDVGYGLQRTVNRLLEEGYGVLGVFMPRMSPGDCTGHHELLFQIPTVGSPLKFFLEPTLMSLNFVGKNGGRDGVPKYRRFHMTGLSGGGWTTTLYAALDPRIRCSVPIAGSLPLYLRSGGSVGDLEQFEPGFYGLAGYPTLYLMGAAGRGRRQVQVLLRQDDCCFGEQQHDAVKTGLPYEASIRLYESKIREQLKRVDSGDFHVVIDSVAPSHMISHHAIEEILLPALKGRR